jgi:hypothetical protein
MSTARELFRAHAEDSGVDETVAQLRQSLSQAKLETLDQVEGIDEAGLKLVMPGLYQKIVATTIQLAAHVGLSVGLALEVMDELRSGCSVSTFSREVRQQMTDTGVEMKRRHSSRIAKLVAEVEAQRLAWRHNHEFLSWLAFRRGDERYPPEDRRERLHAFKVEPRLLQSREVVAELLGFPMAVALEGHDRFMLANRWRLPDSPENAVERISWPLLAFQNAEVTRLEIARHEYDALGEDASDDERHGLGRQIIELVQHQLEVALDNVPEAMTGQVI